MTNDPGTKLQPGDVLVRDWGGEKIYIVLPRNLHPRASKTWLLMLHTGTATSTWITKRPSGRDADRRYVGTVPAWYLDALIAYHITSEYNGLTWPEAAKIVLSPYRAKKEVPELTLLPGDHDKVTTTTEDEAVYAARRKRFEELFDSDELPMATDLIEYVDEDKLDRYLLIQSDGENYLPYTFAEAWMAGEYTISDDSDYWNEDVVDLDTGVHYEVDVARGYYVQEKGEGYSFPQPPKGYVRQFFYIDTDPEDANIFKSPGVGRELRVTDGFWTVPARRLEGVQRNSADIEEEVTS